MVHAVTTTDLLLQEISGTLSEVRDLLQQDQSKSTPARKAPAKKAAAKSAAAKKTARKG